MAYRSVNPYNNEVLHEFDTASDQDLEAGLKLANQTYHEMKDQPIHERGKILHQIAERLRENKADLAKTATLEMGKLYREAVGEVELCALIADWFGDHGEELLEPDIIPTMANGEAKVLHQSIGVIMMVEPWNFPYYQIMRVFAPNFMVGNTMILKHASNTPMSAQKFTDMMIDGGAPRGALTNLYLSYDQVQTAIADDRVVGVALTGSNRGGSAVAEAAGKNLKHNTMELGGMDPFLVLEDANMDDVNNVAWRTRMYNDGQVCTSSKRYIVVEDRYDEFVNSLAKHFDDLTPGDPLDENTTLAPMNSKKAKEKLQQQVEDAIKAGAKVVYGNQPIDKPGQFFMPTILTDVDEKNPAYNTEMFGPVAVVYRAKDTEDAIRIANDSHFGLGGMVFCGDPEYGAKVAAKIETGMVFVNSFLATLPELPFGGVKDSGYGREMSKIGQLAFVNDKLIVKADKPDFNNLAGALVYSEPNE